MPTIYNTATSLDGFIADPDDGLGWLSADVRIASGDVAGPHDDMRRVAGDRDVWIVGGGELAGQFHDRRRLDRVIVTIASVTLGAGAPLLPRRIHPPLRLTFVTRTGPEFVELHDDVIHGEETHDRGRTTP